MRTSRKALITVGVVTSLGACVGTTYATATPARTSARTTSTHSLAASSSAPACRTTQLAVWRAAPGSGTTGGTYYELEFSNVSKSACSLTGYPRVFAVGHNGSRIGRAATHDMKFAPAPVVLSPRTTAHAVLRVADAGVYSPSTCHPTAAVGVKVFPPSRPRGEIVPLRFTACASDTPTLLTVRVVRPRAGIPGVSQ
jgi:hypothetical protein